MRIRGAKTELEEAGLETDGMVESTAKLREEILALSGVDIMENNNTFKSTYKIMEELAAKWQDLSDIQQATVTELIAGKRQGNIVSSLMNNFDIAEQALETSLNSAGSAMQEHEKWQQSLEAQILKLKAAWQGLSQSFLSSNFLKTALNVIIELVDGVTKLIDTLGTVPTILTGFTLYKSFGNKGFFRTFNTELDGFINKIGIANRSFADLANAFNQGRGKGFKGFLSGVSAVGNSLMGAITKADLKNIQEYNNLIDQGVNRQSAWYRTMMSSSNEAQDAVAKLASKSKDGKVALDGLKTASIGGKFAMIGLKAATIAFNAALTMGISLLIDWAISGIQKIINAKEELAESVEEVTSKYKEQHDELKKLKNSYDTTNESSMASKYGELSKGVDGLGRNVSLTADEYAEYQSIVNTIADQIPSLVSGYDEQGNAVLSCKGNVEELVAAYEKLIHIQNQEILAGSSGDIEKDWENTLKQANGYDLWENLGQFFSFDGFFGGELDHYDMKTDTAEWLNGLTSDMSLDEIERQIVSLGANGERELIQVLQNAGYDVNVWSGSSKLAETLQEALKKEPQKIKGILENYYAGFDEAVAEYKTKATALLSEAFDVSSTISGLNYGNISEELQNIAYQTVNSLDFDFLNELSEKGITIEQWTTEMLGQLNAISKADNAEIEAGFDLQTQFNGGEISYGEYVNNLKNLEDIINNLGLSDEVTEQLKIALNLDEDGIIKQYEGLVERLTDSENYDFNISEDDAKSFLNSLSSEELAIAVDVITQMSNNNIDETIDQVRNAVERELALQGLTLELDIEVETTKLEALSTAIGESFSGSGLSSDSIDAVEGMFSELSSYDPSKLFERTANGISLNTKELNRLNSEYRDTNLAKVNEELNSLGDVYNQTREELYRLTYGTDEYNAKAAELSGIEERINAAERLISQYEGLSSAYQEWQMVESAGSQRDMYESLIEGLENIDDEISRGWYDDGTIEFLELLTGKELSTAGIEEVKKAYKSLGQTIEHTSYSVRDFFTVDEDGNSTNDGVYNFLDAIGQMEEEKFGGQDVVQRENGRIVGFNFDLVGGDKVIAEALGVSEELVQIMVRAADDAGFVVTLDGSYEQLDTLKVKAQEAAESLKNIMGEDGYDFDFNVGTIEEIMPQLEEAKKILDTFRNADGTINTEIEGADEALTVASTLQSMLDRLNRPAYMNIQISQVEEELQEPLRSLQQLQTLTETEHQFKLSGTDTSELEESKDEIYAYFEELDPEVKAELGLVDEKGNPLTGQALKDKLNSGDVSIEATVDVQMEMDEKLGILVDKALLDAGIIDEEEFQKRVNIYLDADVDNGDAKTQTEQAVSEIVDNTNGTSGDSNATNNAVEIPVDAEVETGEVKTESFWSRFWSTLRNNWTNDETKSTEVETDVNVEAGNIDTSGVNEKVNEAVEEVVELEVKAEEVAGMVEELESKDILIDVTVEGLDDVIELNKNIDLATEIDGDIDKLSEFAEGAKALSGLDDNITSYVTASIHGNVTDEFEYKIDNLKVFADGAKELKDVGSFDSDITANVYGNVIETFEYQLDNLKVYSDSAKDLESIGTVESSVTANVDGNIVDTFEYKIDNLKVYSDSAKDLGSIGTIDSKVTANVDGNVIETFEYQLDNLKTYSDSAKDVSSIGTVDSKVTANVDGNIVDTFEYKIDNLKVYSDSAKDLGSIGAVESSATANVDGNVIETFEYQLDNLKVFSDSAKDLESIGDVNSKVTANVDGNVIDEFEYQLDNLKVFSDSAKDLESIGTVDSKVTANVDGNVIETFEYKIDNLKVYSDSAKDIESIGDVNSKVTANVDGNVIETPEYMINNLKVYSDSAVDVDDIGSVESSVTANAYGNVINTPEYMIDNLKVFTNSAEDVESIGDVNSSVTANVDGNVINTPEYMIDNLKVYSNSAEDIEGIGDVKSNVTANVYGNVINTTEESIDNLGVFADNANKLKDTGNFTSSVSANVSGNIITDDTVVTDLEHFASVVSGMSTQTVTVSVTANVDSANINSAITLLQNVANSGVFKDYSATVQVGATIATIDDSVVQNYNAPQKDGKVAYTVDSSAVDIWTAPPKDGVVNYDASVEALTYAQKHKTGTITYKANIVGLGPAAGTAHANGSANASGSTGRAFARGDWGIKGNGVALGGELGQELVVRDGKFFTIGDAGAEFFRYKKNDIVFNAAQTASLFKYGGIKGANPRGKMLANGTAFSYGSGGAGRAGAGNSVTGATYGSSSKSSSSSSSSDSSDDFEETLDWIETKIERIERAIDQLDTKANSVYRSWSERNKALVNEISKVEDEIAIQQKAYDKYMSAASGVGLSSSYAEKVRNGKIDIETITDETLKEKIDDYTEWYEKALDCKDAILELKETEAELYAQRIENVSTQYEGILGVIEHEKNVLDEFISQTEANAMLVSANYYNALAKNEQKTITQLEKEKAAMLKELQTAMESGTIAVKSEAWYEMVASIDEVTLAIAESQTAIKEYEQTIQQLKWEQFDLLQDKISSVTEETEFLIDLMSSDKLHDDNGQLTDSGSATMGLHGVAYNANMYQADLAAEEAKRLENQLAKDPYDTELEERYREMVSLQQEYILAAQDEKEAIKDLVSDGIELEIEALEKRIDKYNEALDSQKDLYDYQKKVKEQTEEIASLEKQIASYGSGSDTSEETQAKVQELKVSLEEAKADLEETEYDKYISDTQQMLDNLTLEYSELLNMRLDNIDALISDMIAEINADAASISSTLSEKAESVGYTLSDSMSTVWDANSTKINNVITTYGEKFSTAQTTTNHALNVINTNLQNMITQLNKLAKTNVKSASTSSAANSKEANAKKKETKPATTNKTNATTSTQKSITVGGKINAGSAKIYDYAGDTSGERQLYRNDPIYKVLRTSGNWLQVRWHKLSSGITGWFKKGDVKAYATGKKNFLGDEIAWTQEKGKEFIVRPSDGAILTPIAKGDSVLNANASNNIWDMANSPAEFIKDNLNLGIANAPNGANVRNNCVQNFDKIIFNMPNVHSYDEMLTQMQKDKSFEKLILAMTIDRIAGGSSLAKNKSIR